MPFSLYMQKYGPDGSVDAKSTENALGRSSLTLWELLFRESLQNSWDARIVDSIEFSIADRWLTPQETRTVRESIFSDLPPTGQCNSFEDHVKGGQIRVLSILDEGTRGLGGPLRADVAAEEGQRRDFVDFVRNIGRSEGKGLQGGTYGYGKGVLYRTSRLGICLVYSQVAEAEGIESRLIGISGGDVDYDFAGHRYTGRNWWGVPGAEGIVDPLRGESARELALAAGMLLPEGTSTGTSIMILAPEEEGLDVGETRIDALSAAALKWAWPLALPDSTGRSPIRFRFQADQEPQKSIAPHSEPAYRGFIDAYRATQLALEISDDERKKPSIAAEIIRSKKPQRVLGNLAFCMGAVEASYPHDLTNTVALMRAPRTIVKYLPITPPSLGNGISGVFVADPDADEIFARSEPATHDEWIIERVSPGKNQANLVKIALDRIRDVFTRLRNEDVNGRTDSGNKGISRISADLGNLLEGFAGHGAEKTVLKASNRVARRSVKPSARLKGPPKLILVDGTAVSVFEFQIGGGRLGKSVELSVRAEVITESGAKEKEAPENAQIPEFLYWIKGEGEILTASSIVTDLSSEIRLRALFIQPEDAAIRAVATVREVSNA